MFRVEVYEYVKKYKRFNRICNKEVSLDELMDWYCSYKDIKLISKGYKIVIRPVDPEEFW